MNENFTGFNEQVATFTCESALTKGSPVTAGLNGSVISAAADAGFVGVVKSVRGGYAAVQLHGYMTVPYSGTLNLGVAQLAANGSGGVKTGTGRTALVLDIDTAAHVAGIDLI